MTTTDEGKPPNAPINFDEFAPLNRLPMVGSYLHMMPYAMYICMLGSLIHFFWLCLDEEMWRYFQREKKIIGNQVNLLPSLVHFLPSTNA